MGRLLLFLGLIAMLVGIGGSIFSVAGSLGGLMPNIQSMLPSTDNLCNAGETLEMETDGVTVYTPGSGYAQTSRLYCVDSAGNRREVTGNFAEGAMGQIGTLFNDIMGGVGAGFMWTGLTIVGVILMIVGAIMSGRRRMRVVVNGMNMNSGDVVRVGGQVMQISPDSNIPARGKAVAGVDTQDLTNKLRQLDQARSAGLVTQEEYDRLRQQILESLNG